MSEPNVGTKANIQTQSYQNAIDPTMLEKGAKLSINCQDQGVIELTIGDWHNDHLRRAQTNNRILGNAYLKKEVLLQNNHHFWLYPEHGGSYSLHVIKFTILR